MRKFAFVVFDVIENTITERFPLDLVTDLSGLGWKLKLSKLEGDVADTLTKVVQEKQSVSIAINFKGRGYEKYSILTQWLQKYSGINNSIALEYNDGTQARYAEGKVTELKKTEKNEFGLLSCAASFTPLTPFFTNVQNTIKFYISKVGKSYPFKYPYSYGKNLIQNNEINNPYISTVPVTVKIEGPIDNPDLNLIDENGESYNHVRFSGKSLSQGQYILINSARHKIWFFDGVKLSDYSAETDPQFDTFLFAKSGLSKLNINIDVTNNGSLTGSWRQYSL